MGDNKGTLTLIELQEGVRRLVGMDIEEDIEEMKSVIKRAYNASRRLVAAQRKGSDKTVDKTEFHGFIITFGWMLHVAEIFESIDTLWNDQKLSYTECWSGLHRFEEWHVDKVSLKKLFGDVDPWVPKLKYADFADFLVECRWKRAGWKLDEATQVEMERQSTVESIKHSETLELAEGGTVKETYVENKRRIMEIFEHYDTDGNGTISEEELLTVLTALSPDMTEDMAKKLYTQSDSNSDGEVDLDEFVQWLLS